MSRQEIQNEWDRIKKELLKELQKEIDDWQSPKDLAIRIKKSPSFVYKLVRVAKELKSKGKDGGIPFAEPSKGTILFSWSSVNKWLHLLETAKRYKNFEE
jgi:hypothetical protein